VVSKQAANQRIAMWLFRFAISLLHLLVSVVW